MARRAARNDSDVAEAGAEVGRPAAAIDPTAVLRPAAAGGAA